MTRSHLRWPALLVSLLLILSACGNGDNGDDGAEAASGATECELDQVDGDLALYNWAEYIDPDHLQAFADEYGIAATMTEYDSNEAMLPVVSAGNSGYDVVVPSDYMVGIMIDGGFVQPLNTDLIPNMSNISDDFANPSYDPEQAYSVPYQWGYTGLAVDTEVVGTDFPRSWDIVFGDAVPEPAAGKITLLNDPRETMGAALKALGYSLNTTDDGELAEARDLVTGAKDDLLRFDTDSSDELLTAGESAIAHGYSGDMFTQFLETDTPERYVFFVPEEGGTRWIDNMVIPFDAPHPCTAHTFINWLLDGEQGAELSNWNYYGTPNDASIDLLDEELNSFVTDPELVPGGADSVEEIADTGDFETNYTDAFTEAKG